MKLPLYTTHTVCTQHANCASCRDPGVTGTRFRAAIAVAFDVPGNWPTCPEGFTIGGATPMPAIGQARVPTDPSELPCVHRGARLDDETCTTCVGVVRAKIRGCSVHTKSTYFTVPISGVTCCGRCPDREAP